MIITVKREGFLADRELSIRAWRRVKKAALLAMGNRWHQKYLRFHFGGRETVRARYGAEYMERTKEYKRRKLKKKGQRSLLVWSGALRRAAMNDATFKAYPTRVTIDLKYPTKIKRTRNRRWGKQQLDQELGAVSDAEMRDLADFLEKRLHAEIAKENSVRVKRFR
jgi:hypothetical protein